MIDLAQRKSSSVRQNLPAESMGKVRQRKDVCKDVRGGTPLFDVSSQSAMSPANKLLN